MVVTRRSTRSSTKAPAEAEPSPSKASPTPKKRQTRVTSKTSTPTKDSAEVGTTTSDAVEEITPSKRLSVGVKSKRASPATQKSTSSSDRSKSPVAEVDSTMEESENNASASIDNDVKDVDEDESVDANSSHSSKNTTDVSQENTVGQDDITINQGNVSQDEDEEHIAIEKNDEDEHIAIEQDDEEEVENDEEIDDVEALVNMAVSSFQSSAEPTSNSISLESTKPQLIPNTLISGVSKENWYLKFSGKKCANGAILAPERKMIEELKQFAKTQKATEAQNKFNASVHVKTTDTGKNRMSSKWFNMVSNEMTAEAKRDIQLIKMRNYLDPKRFYKSSDHTKSNMPKVFQVGTVIEGAAEFKSSRLSRKERQQTFTDEILHDHQIRNYAKRKYIDIQNSKANTSKKTYKAAKHQRK